MQIFFSLGPGWGGIISMASFNKFRYNHKLWVSRNYEIKILSLSPGNYIQIKRLAILSKNPVEKVRYMFLDYINYQ